MRVRKYRAWCPKFKEMSYHVDLYMEGDEFWWSADYIGEDGQKIGSFEQSSGGVLMEFTGLQDAEGKDIYEEDLIVLPEEKALVIACTVPHCLVRFSADTGAFMFGREKEKPEDMQTYLWIVADECKVIGNSRENPELMEQLL